MTLLVAAISGAVGAVFRYLVSGWIQGSVLSDFPIGTLAVNLTGSFGLGLVVGVGSLDSMLAIAAVGFFGGFTTFSSWMVETIRLGPRSSRALVNLAVSVVAGVACAALGYTLTH